MTETIPVGDIPTDDLGGELDAVTDEITSTESELAQVQAEERSAAGVADPDEHHRLMDRIRWLTGKLNRLRDRREAILARQVQTRKDVAAEDATRILTETPLGDVVDAFRYAESAIENLISTCGARQEAVRKAARVLRGGGWSASSLTGAKPVVVLAGDQHSLDDAAAGPLVGELMMVLSTRHGLRTSGGRSLTDVLGPVVPRVSRGRVARMAGAV